MIARRIVTEISPGMRHKQSTTARRTCRASIKLDGLKYGCGRALSIVDGAHGGVHDAFAVHHDGGEVRW